MLQANLSNFVIILLHYTPDSQQKNWLDSSPCFYWYLLGLSLKNVLLIVIQAFFMSIFLSLTMSLRIFQVYQLPSQWLSQTEACSLSLDSNAGKMYDLLQEWEFNFYVHYKP